MSAAPDTSKANHFDAVINRYRAEKNSARDLGNKFERLMQAYLRTDRIYAARLQKVWLWGEFPYRNSLGGNDLGIDLVALDDEGGYWAIQCKCYEEGRLIDKSGVDSFISASGRGFNDDAGRPLRFSRRLWISTTNNWTGPAEHMLFNQEPPFTRINLDDLRKTAIDWEKLAADISGDKARISPFPLKDHQQEALEKTHEYFKTQDRGKLIMACGTGKTFTSLRIAEKETGGKGLVLFLVPSIALMGQTLREWSNNAMANLYPICVCSDGSVGKQGVKIKDKEGNDVDQLATVDLALPATTDVEEIAKRFRQKDPNQLTVIFSTYQSLERIEEAQKKLQAENPDRTDEFIFDLAICDEAHRTAGMAGRLNKKEAVEMAKFTRIHDNSKVAVKKRLYMTATPKVYGENAKKKADEAEIPLCSMDDVAIYGKEIYRLGFGAAVEKKLLSDYKVVVFTVAENNIPPKLLERAKLKENEKSKSDGDVIAGIDLDDLARVIGSVSALSKKTLGQEELTQDDPNPMRRAVAFCQNIKISKKITEVFNTLVEEYGEDFDEESQHPKAKHVDGTMGAADRDKRLDWLGKEEIPSGEARILTNVRCLSEGVDVPALDAVLFLAGKNSQVEVVQSVGRVMRTAPGKKWGYIVIPIFIPVGVEPEEELNRNKTYKVVWDVCNALRAHDERFDIDINSLELNKGRSKKLIVAGSDTVYNKDGTKKSAMAVNASGQLELPLEFRDLQEAIYSLIVTKCGNRKYWSNWAAGIGKITQRQIKNIKKLVSRPENQAHFETFVKSLKATVNPSIDAKEAIEMLAMHKITKPVFNALLGDDSFTAKNPISQALDALLQEMSIDLDGADESQLKGFYDSVTSQVKEIEDPAGRQELIMQLYEDFFSRAFGKMKDQLGIVYTPVEVVDFINHSVNDILQKEFGKKLADKGVKILDPFTGTGTFIRRLLDSKELIPKERFADKYEQDLFANEIVLLAYYIAAVNIENTYRERLGEKAQYQEFPGICLTDTFALGEGESKGLFDNLLTKNSERAEREQESTITVIVGNPPYSIGQKDANDNAKNQDYEHLDKRIEDSYAAARITQGRSALYDSYIRAFRWASDRVGAGVSEVAGGGGYSGGIVCFVTNGGWLTANSADGFRRTLEREFDAIYVFNLRGDARTSGETWRREGGKIFGQGSRQPIAITLLVKKPKETEDRTGIIYYHDIGDYLTREEKLQKIKKASSFAKLSLEQLQPNDHADWLKPRQDYPKYFISLMDKDRKKEDSQAKSFFLSYSQGVKTNRDSWCFNFSQEKLKVNINHSIDFYQEELERLRDAKGEAPNLDINDFINRDKTQFHWDKRNIDDLNKGKELRFNEKGIRMSLYRPFCNEWLYFDQQLNNTVAQIPKLFPIECTENLVIAIPKGRKEFSTFLAQQIPNYDCLEKAQYFPLYFYKPKEKDLFISDDRVQGYERVDAISDFILKKARGQYHDDTITKEDIFYYVYGFLHHPVYRETFKDTFSRELPQIPLVASLADFRAFAQAGRELGRLHTQYEAVPPYPGVKVTGEESGDFSVTKMRYGKKGKETLCDTIIYNNHITISGIPLAAYDYIVNGQAAIDWILDRYQVKIDKDTEITNDPNDWAREHEKPRYILDLLLSVINVSMQTLEIVKNLPLLDLSQGAKGE